MSEPEHFLTRWSRLKREGGEPADEHPAVEDVAAAPALQQDVPSAEPADAAPGEPAFDLASLPPIESITATTDIRPFLAPGVPAALTRAALRRMWTADPQIRDFIEIAENQWDFATPDSIPGFSTFQAGDDVGRYVAELGGKAEELLEKVAGSTADEASAPLPTPVSVRTDDAPDERGQEVSPAESIKAVVRRNENDAASPKEPAGTQHAALPTRRSRGGALPQ